MSLEGAGEPADISRIVAPRGDALQLDVHGRFSMGLSGKLTGGCGGYTGELKDESGFTVGVDLRGNRIVDAGAALSVKAPELHGFSADTAAELDFKYKPAKRFSLEAGYVVKSIIEADEGEVGYLNLQNARRLKIKWEPVPRSFSIETTLKSGDSLYDSKSYRDYTTREIAFGLNVRPPNIFRLAGDFSRVEKGFHENPVNDSATELLTFSVRSPYRRRIGGGIAIERLFKNYVNAPDKTYIRNLISIEGEYRPAARLAIRGVLERAYKAFVLSADKDSLSGSARVEVSGKRLDNVAFEVIGEIGHVVFPSSPGSGKGTRLLSARVEFPLGQGTGVPILSIKAGSQYKGYMDEDLMDGNYDKRMLEIKLSEDLDDIRRIAVEIGHSRKVYLYDPSGDEDETVTTFGIIFTQEFD